jgi:hypothetical protein
MSTASAYRTHIDTPVDTPVPTYAFSDETGYSFTLVRDGQRLYTFHADSTVSIPCTRICEFKPEQLSTMCMPEDILTQTLRNCQTNDNGIYYIQVEMNGHVRRIWVTLKEAYILRYAMRISSRKMTSR